MIYLESFRLASESDETGYLLSGRKPSNPYPKGHKLAKYERLEKMGKLYE